MSPTRLLPLLCCVAAACTSLHDDLSRTYLTPATEWLVEPAQLGLAAEPFALDVAGGASLTGWFVRAANAEGRTVVLFHGSRANASMLHPYYTFLVEAGLNVCVFDYRGYGKSKGEPAIRGLFYDMPALLDWLRARADVDPQKIAFYGLSLGSVVALHAAVHERCCRALVLENVPSPRDAIRARIEDRGQVATTLATGFAEFASLPEGIEPSENAALLTVPSLWIGGTDEPHDELRATLRAFFEMRGDKQLWVLPDTGRAPHSLLTHDGEYQRAVGRFLRSALDGTPEQVAVSWRRLDTTPTGAGVYEIGLARRGAADAGPWAVELCALDADGKPNYAHTWLDAATGAVRMELPAEPGAVSAMRVGDAERTASGAFARSGTALSRAGRWYDEHFAAFDRLAREQVAVDEIKRLAATIREREQIEPLPRLLEEELAATFASIGTVLATSGDAEDRAAARIWLQRAIAATPEHPERHYWPGRHYTAGFPQAGAVAAAREQLRQLDGDPTGAREPARK